MHIKGNHIDIHLIHNKFMQIFSHNQPYQSSHAGQHQVFTEYITGSLISVKTQHLDGRYFTQPFSDIDVGQVVQDNKRQGTCADDDQKDHIVQAFHHAAKTNPHILICGYRRDALAVHHCRRYLIYILPFLHIQISAPVFRLLSDLRRPGLRRQVHIIIDKVLADSGYTNRQAISILIA